jgi:hypothetical protein
MGWEQWTLVFLVFSGFGIGTAKYGEKKLGYWDWTDLIGTPIILGLLWSGGFFNG